MSFSKNQLIVFGLGFHILAAIFSIGRHQSDELFQVFEFAGYKLGINSARELPWEFGAQMRSGLQPLLVYCFTKCFHWASANNPFTIALFVRLFQSLLSFLSVFLFLRVFEKEILSEKKRKQLWFFSLLLWCLPYFHARFSSENFSMTLFLFGLVALLEGPGKVSKAGLAFCAGLLFGLAFISRFQISFMILGLIGWLLFMKKEHLSKCFLLLCGIFVSIGIGVLIDIWFYGKPVLSWWNYLNMNVFENKAAQFGESPFYFYLVEGLLQLIPPFSLLIVFGILGFWFKFKKHLITWVTLPFVILHFFVSHKELRFLFPLINFLPFMLTLFAETIQVNSSWPKALRFLSNKKFIGFVYTVNFLLLLFFTLKPADETSFTLKKIYDTTKGEASVLFYEKSDPYNNQASLHYFRNNQLVTLPIDSAAINMLPDKAYFLSETYGGPWLMVKSNMVFVKRYASFPPWIEHLNFNGWLERSGSFSIYEKIN